MVTAGDASSLGTKARGAAPRKTKNVRGFPDLADAKDLDRWVAEIYDYVEGEATKAIDWYIQKSRGKRLGSRWIRYWTVILGGVAGLLPIVSMIWPQGWRLEIPSDRFSLVSSLLIGVVALLLALDNFSDFSRGWMRYVLTAFEIRASLQEFRMSWAAEWSRRPAALDAERAAALILLAKDFVLRVEQLVGQETRQWASEFAQNLAQMEKEVAARWEERQKQSELQREAAKPGAVQLTVSNAKATDDRKFTVVLQSGEGSKAVEATVTGTQTWVRTSVAPGMYTIAVEGTINQKLAGASQVIQVKAGEVREVSLALME